MDVSIICRTYNHKQYICKCLDSIISQDVNFDFEIIIHDDASTDGTSDILLEYKKKYPRLISLIIQKYNLFSKNIPFDRKYNWTRIHSRYVVFCDGDDYFASKTKLQKQYNFLEKNPNYSLVFHPVFINENNKIYKQEISQDFFSLQNLLEQNYIYCNSVMYRWIFSISNMYILMPSYILPTDWYINLLHAEKGKIGFINEYLSVYRKHSGGIWSNKNDTMVNWVLKHGVENLNFYYCIKSHFNILKRNNIEYLERSISYLIDINALVKNRHLFNKKYRLKSKNIFVLYSLYYFLFLCKQIKPLNILFKISPKYRALKVVILYLKSYPLN